MLVPVVVAAVVVGPENVVNWQLSVLEGLGMLLGPLVLVVAVEVVVVEVAAAVVVVVVVEQAVVAVAWLVLGVV